MKAWFKKLPLPVSGLMLGLAALGSLLAPYSVGTRNLLGGLAGIILLLLVVKVILFPECLKENLADPVTAPALATFPMSLMILSTYVRPLMPTAAYLVWQVSIGLSVLTILLFTRTYVLDFDLEKVFPGWFVLYVGIAVAAVTAPAYGMEILGRLVFWFGLLVYLPLLPLVTYRVLKVRGIPESAMPSLILYAAPASLLLTGYLRSFPMKDHAILIPLGILALLMTLYGLVQMARLLMKLPFHPGFSAFTFPFVISAIAFSGMADYLTGAGYPSSWFIPVRTFMVLGSTLVVLFVLFQYVWFMAGPDKADLPPDHSRLNPEAERETSEMEPLLSGRNQTVLTQDQHAFTGNLPVSGQEDTATDKEKAV